MDHKIKIDMLHGQLLLPILKFAIPIIMTGVLQQLFNFVDTAIVGKFTDSNALAAVGTNGEIVALLITISAGLSLGVNVRIANIIGQRKMDKLSNIIKTSFLLSIMIGILIAILGCLFTKNILQAIQVPSEILALSVTYLQIYLFGIPFLLLYDFAAAILRAFGDSKRPFIAMTIAGGLNVILNLALVTVFQLGVSGVAIATSFSNLISCIMVVYWIIKDGYIQNLYRFSFDLHEAVKFLKVGVPAAIQGAVFCFANIFVQSAVNTLGVSTVAGASIAMNFEYLTYHSITAFGQTATTFVSQNFTARKINRCKRITIFTMTSSFLICFLMTFPIVLFRETAANIFSNDTAAIQAASIRITMILLFEPICAIYECFAGTIRGLGRSLLPAIITILGTCFLRISWIFFVFSYAHTEEVLYFSFPLSWVITSILMMIAYLIMKKNAYEEKYDKQKNIHRTFSLHA